MSAVDLHWDDDAAAGAWIAGRLGEFGTVGGNVPLGYELYVRIPNSRDPEDNAASLIQFRSESPGGAVEGDGDQLDRLLAVLAPATGDQMCHFAIWNGYGDFYDNGTDPRASRSVGMVVSVGPGSTAAEAAAARDEAWQELVERMIERPAAPMLELPHRDYHLWHGRLAAARALERGHYSPTLMWPEDRSWFLSSDIDSAFSEVGGSRAALAPMLADLSWAAVEVSVTDSLVPG